MAREVQEAMDEIERLREQIKALVHEWELSERGVHCEHKEVCDEI
jgi:archaellum component FlaC